MFDSNVKVDVSESDESLDVEDLVQDRVEVKGEVTDFSRFNFDTPIPTKGEYVFTCAVQDLLEATRVTALTTTASYNKIPTTRVTVYSDGVVRIATYNIFTFSEVSIPTVGHKVSFSEPVEAFAFIISHTQLLNIAKAFLGELQFKYLAESHMLEVQNEDTCLGLAAYSAEGFIDNLQQIKSIVPTYSCPVDTEELKKAFDFVSPFAKRNITTPKYSVLEVRNSSVMGGTKTVTGVYASARLPKELQFRVRYEAIPVVSKLLARFKPDSTYLFDFEKYFVIRDANYILGFEKVLEDFPDMGHLLSRRMPESIVVPRVHLQGHLARVLAVLSKNVDISPSVAVEVKGSGAEAMMYLKTTETSGRESVTKLPCFRQSDDLSKPFKDVSFKVSSTHLTRVIHCFDSSNCCFALDDREVALFIIDPVSEGVCATSVLALLVAVV